MGLYVNWPVASAVLISTIGISACSRILAFYRNQIRLRGLARTKQLEETIRAHEATIQARDKDLRLEKATRERDASSILSATEALHDLIHVCTREARELREAYEDLSGAKANLEEAIASILAKQAHFFTAALSRTVSVFRPLVETENGAPVRLWSALRRVQYDGKRIEYVTFAREGEFHPDRDLTSEAMAYGKGHPQLVRDAYNNGVEAVIRQPSDDGEIPLENYKFEENESMLIAGIPLFDGERIEVPMLLYVNCSAGSAFAEHHKPYMKCCADTLSTLINSFLGGEALVQIS
jgi:hypothetical protein